MSTSMERYFCVGLGALVALMAADREATAADRTDLPAVRPPPQSAHASSEHGVTAAYTAHS